MTPMTRTEIQAALDSLELELRGLKHMAAIARLQGVKIAVAAQTRPREIRRELLRAAIAAHERLAEARAALGEDGYPALEGVSFAGDDELQECCRHIASGAALFIRGGR